MSQYNIFKNGTGTLVYEISTGRRGIVREIRETSFEWIEPFVDFGDGKLEKANTYNLLVVPDETNTNDAK